MLFVVGPCAHRPNGNKTRVGKKKKKKTRAWAGPMLRQTRQICLLGRRQLSWGARTNSVSSSIGPMRRPQITHIAALSRTVRHRRICWCLSANHCRLLLDEGGDQMNQNQSAERGLLPGGQGVKLNNGQLLANGSGSSERNPCLPRSRCPRLTNPAAVSTAGSRPDLQGTPFKGGPVATRRY